MPTSTGRSRRWNTRAKIRTSSRRSRPTSSQRANGISSPGSKTPRTCWRAPTWTSTRFGRVGCLTVARSCVSRERTWSSAVWRPPSWAFSHRHGHRDERAGGPPRRTGVAGPELRVPARPPVAGRRRRALGADRRARRHLEIAAGEIIGKEASGTMPHALLIAFGRGNQEEAWTAFDEAAGPDVPASRSVTRTPTRSTSRCGRPRPSTTWTASASTRRGRAGATSATSCVRCAGRSTPTATTTSASSPAAGPSGAAATSGTSSRVRRRELRQQRRPAGLRARHRRTRQRARGQAREADREEGGVPHARRRPPRRPGRPRGARKTGRHCSNR